MQDPLKGANRTREKELIDDSPPPFPFFYFNLVSGPSEGVTTGTTDRETDASVMIYDDTVMTFSFLFVES